MDTTPSPPGIGLGVAGSPQFSRLMSGEVGGRSEERVGGTREIVEGSGTSSSDEDETSENRRYLFNFTHTIC